MATVDDPIATLAYEDSRRGEVLAAFAHRFHRWDANDPRWNVVQNLWGLLDFPADPEAGIDRPARIATCVLTLIDTVDTLIVDRGETEASIVGAILRAGKTIEAEAFAFLSDAGARHEVAR